jgi:hypothetical protein
MGSILVFFIFIFFCLSNLFSSGISKGKISKYSAMISLRLICGVLLAQFTLFASAVQDQNSFSCDSPIYCDGPILKTVQMTRVFSDSKTFVDMVRITN